MSWKLDPESRLRYRITRFISSSSLPARSIGLLFILFAAEAVVLVAAPFLLLRAATAATEPSGTEKEGSRLRVSAVVVVVVCSPLLAEGGRDWRLSLFPRGRLHSASSSSSRRCSSALRW